VTFYLFDLALSTRTRDLRFTPEKEIASVNPPHFAGVEQSDDALEWIWNQQFAAVAGDAPSFETWRISLYNLAKCSYSKGLSLT
jgi:hypothetical protein